MRLLLTRVRRLLRRQRSTPFAKHALAQCAKSDANRRFFSSCNAAWLPPGVLQKRPNTGSNGIALTCAVGCRLLLKQGCNPALEFLRSFSDGYRGPRPPGGGKLVAVSSEIWRLLEEYDVPGAMRRVFNVQIQATQTSSKQVQLMLRGWNAGDVAALLGDPPRKMVVHKQVGLWLVSKGPNGTRVTDIKKRCGALVQKSQDNKSVLLVGPSEATLAAKRIMDECDCIQEFDIDRIVGFYLVNNESLHLKRLSVETDALISAIPAVGATKWKAVVVGPTESVKRLRRKLDEFHVKRHRVPQAVRGWLTNPGKRSGKDARSLVLDRKFGTYIDVGLLSDDSDPARMVDLVVVGDHKENVDDALSLIDRLHIKFGQISPAVHGWLTNTSKGAKCARSMELNQKFDAHIALGPVNVDASVVNFAIVGERAENVDQVLAVVGHIAVEKVNMTELQEEFWMGHEDEKNRNRPRHKIEDTTDACILVDFDARCLHVAGRPDCVRAAVEQINKTQHIALRSSVVSFATANYIARARGPYENDDRQIHLAYKDTRPGTRELRRLYVVASQGDEAKADKDDEGLMRKLDLDEIVLEVPKWASFLVGQCREMEKDTTTGIGFSEDAVNRRVILAIAGSRSTVKQGMNEVIRRIEAHHKYKEGDICLRRIQGQSVDLTGFKRTGDAHPLVLSCCKEPFLWERLTRERWRYAGGPRGGRPPKRPRQPSV